MAKRRLTGVENMDAVGVRRNGVNGLLQIGRSVEKWAKCDCFAHVFAIRAEGLIEIVKRPMGRERGIYKPITKGI
jgi:hypothetical protein